MKVKYKRHVRTVEGAAAWIDRFVEPEVCEPGEPDRSRVDGHVPFLNRMVLVVYGKEEVPGSNYETARRLAGLGLGGGFTFVQDGDLGRLADDTGDEDIILAVKPGVLIPTTVLDSIREAFEENQDVAALGFVTTKELPPFGGWPAASTALWAINEGPNFAAVRVPPVGALAFRASILKDISRWNWERWSSRKDALALLASTISNSVRGPNRVLVDRAVLCHDQTTSHARAMEEPGDTAMMVATVEADAPVWFSEEQQAAVSMLAGRKDDRPEVVFLFREVEVCGLVLLAYRVCDKLCERGFNARVACTRLDPGNERLLQARFVPDVFPSESDMVAGLARRLAPGSVVVNSLFHTAKIARDIELARPHITPVYYVQDDERMFLGKQGKPYADPDSVEACWRSFDRRLANSPWVAEALTKCGAEPDGVITPGVDTAMFTPGEKAPSDIPVVMAHCRPSTPRRGWDFIKKVVEVAAFDTDFVFVTYDQDPGELALPEYRHLGKLSQARVAEEMKHADVFIEGSVFQGFGMQALEAMASGLALLSTSNRGVDAYGISMHDCIITTYGDVKLAVSLLKKLVSSAEDRRVLGKNAVETAARFDWDKVVDGWVSYLTGVCGLNMNGAGVTR